MKYLLLLITALLIIPHGTTAQHIDNATKNRIKAMYFTAEDLYQKKEYGKVVNKIKDIESLSDGLILPSAQNLKVKALVAEQSYTLAKKELDVLMQLDLSEAILKDISTYSPKIDAGLEVERKKQEAERERQRQTAERQKEIARRYAAIADAHQDDIKKFVEVLEQLHDGQLYLFKPDAPITEDYNLNIHKTVPNKTEKSYLVCDNGRYIIFTNPSSLSVRELDKNRISYHSSDASEWSKAIAKAKIKTPLGKRDLFFKRVPSKNVFIGGWASDELLWHGQQRTEFGQSIYYYFYEGSIKRAALKAPSFDPKITNPYIETGTLVKAVDYNLVKDPAMRAKLQQYGVKNAKSLSPDRPNLPVIVLKSSGYNRKMILTMKGIKYKLVSDKVLGEVTYSNGSTAKWGFLYFRPVESTAYYGFVEYTGSFRSEDLLDQLYVTDRIQRLDHTSFNTLFNTFNPQVGSKEGKYFINSKFTLPMDVLSKLTDVDFYESPVKPIKQSNN